MQIPHAGASRRANGTASAFYGSTKYRKRAIMLGLAWSFALFGFWGINTWIPTPLKQAGYSLFSSIGVFFLMNTMGVPGSLIGAYLSDKVGRKLLAGFAGKRPSGRSSP